MTRSNAIALAALVGGLAMTGLLLHHPRAAGAPARVGAPLAPFAVAGQDGTVALLDPRRGTIVYNVFATWCPECRSEIADLRRADVLLRARGVRIVGVDQGEAPEVVRAFAARYDIGYPIYIDRVSSSALMLGARVIPTTVIVKDGIVRRIVPGALDASQILALVRAIDE